VRSAKEDNTSSSGEDLSKMGVGILNLIRIMECLRGKRDLSGWDFDRTQKRTSLTIRPPREYATNMMGRLRYVNLSFE